MTGVRARIYRNARLGDCSNGGISGRVDEVTVIDPRVRGPYEPTEDAPAVRVVEKTYASGVYVYLTPIEEPEDMLGPMMGGTYVGMTDSRLRVIGDGVALPLHDRWETPQDYARLSA
jgi:hypothetical protein